MKKQNIILTIILFTGALLLAFTTKQGEEMDTKKLQEVWDRQEIEQLMYRHARSLDRMDAELMKSTYWEDGVEEHQDPIYPDLFHWNDNAWKFVPVAMEGFKNLKVTQHRISNILIELDGDKAVAETYVLAYHVHEENGVDKEGILGGRHHFKLEKRNDEWRILHRSTVFDWNQNKDATAIWSEKFADKYRTKRDKTDDSYNYLKKSSNDNYLQKKKSMGQKGMPGNLGAEHFGFTVPNLKEAIDFFENIIGAEVVYELGPFASDDDWMKDHLNVHPRTKLPKIAIVKCGNGSNFEIFEFESPDQEKRMPKNSDWGGRHIAFYVEDIFKAVEYLKENGIEVLGEPTVMTEGPSAGESWVYFLSPWGMQLELVSYENGKAYEKTSSTIAFKPTKK